MAKVIMIQGTMSSAGKSFLAAGLCRIFRQDGYRTAPFKSQNMASEGLEMGRAQVMQAEAAGISPMVCMNPILLKPTSHTGSQVIVNGEVLGNMSAREYFSYKKKLVPFIGEAFEKLSKLCDIIVIEGAGSPAEINLKENDIVNMGLARMVDAPVLLAGDIDRGGVFAQLLGTLMLLEPEERERVRGLVINKFRGDKSILDPGIEMLEKRGGVPVTGVIPFLDIRLEDEDSLTGRFDRRETGLVDIAVIRYPRISNFTDFNVFENSPDVSVRYVASASELGSPDLIFLPGSKNTMGDLKWMRQNGLEAAVKKMAARGVPVFGVCGGFQMLGDGISDPDGVEEGGSVRGMELLPVRTVLTGKKERRQAAGAIPELPGVLGGLMGCHYEGYEIHMGRTHRADIDAGNTGAGAPAPERSEMRVGSETSSPASGRSETGADEIMPPVISDAKNVYGTYIHGLFDAGDTAERLLRALAEKKGVSLRAGESMDYRSFKEKQYDALADALRAHMNMEEIYGMLKDARLA